MIIPIENIYLEPVHEKHAWRICDFCTINADRLQRFFPGTLKQNLTPDLSQHFVATKVKQFSEKQEFLFVLKEKENTAIIGLVYLKELDWNKMQGELAYAIGYEFEGKGCMTETVNALSTWAFTEHQINTLQIIAHKTNTASVRVAEKCGFIW